MIKYTTTWLKGMNTRPTPSVSNLPNGTVGFGETVNITEVWTASGDGVNVRNGDVWAKLDSAITKWVAVIHMGVTYGTLQTDDTPAPTGDAIVKAVVYFSNGTTQELLP